MENPSISSEYQKLSEDAGLFLLKNQTVLEFTGADRKSFLHNLCTNEIKEIDAGQGCEAFVTNVQGKIIGHITVLLRNDSILISTVPEQVDSLMSHFNRYLVTEDVQIQDQSNQIQCWVLSGAQAVSKLQRAFPGGEIPMNLHSHNGVSNEQESIRVARASMLDGDCFLLLIAPTSTGLAQRMGVDRMSSETFEIARIENRFPIFGVDFSSENLPQELARDRQAISFTKGCYLGQETVARIDALGHVNRQLRLITLPKDVGPESGFSFHVDKKEVARVTSATNSCKYRGPVGLAYVRRPHFEKTIMETDEGEVQILA